MDIENWHLLTVRSSTCVLECHLLTITVMPVVIVEVSNRGKRVYMVMNLGFARDSGYSAQMTSKQCQWSRHSEAAKERHEPVNRLERCILRRLPEMHKIEANSRAGVSVSSTTGDRDHNINLTSSLK